MACIFCDYIESDWCYVCSDCVQKLVNSSVEQLNRMRKTLMETIPNAEDDYRVLFLTDLLEEDYDGDNREHNYGRRAEKTLRRKQVNYGKIAKRKTAAMFKGDNDPTTVP